MLILVRKRGALFEEILRALKHARIPVAGADRLALSEHIVFDDLLALARFALFPADDLTLAALLRSPFCDVDDESLYRLAKGREGDAVARPCWTAPTSGRNGAAAADFLAGLIAEARARGRSSSTAACWGCATPRAAPCARACCAGWAARRRTRWTNSSPRCWPPSSAGVHDLESLAAAFASLDITVKRELEAGRDEVRVMTAHGAKGLEAPIVFLPETTTTAGARGSPLMETEDGGFLWCASQKGDCEASAPARELRGAQGERGVPAAALRGPDPGPRAAGALRPDRVEPQGGDAEGLVGADPRRLRPRRHRAAVRDRGLRRGLATALRAGPGAHGRAAAAASAAAPPSRPGPREAATAEAFARYASPSDLGEGAKAPAPSPLAAAGGLGRFRRGDLIHRLLQILPDLRARRAGRPARRRLLARERDLTDAQRAEMTAAALSVLEDPASPRCSGRAAAPRWRSPARAAALPAGLKISGRIDRLVVLPDRVLVADFKTNRPSPGAHRGRRPGLSARRWRSTPPCWPTSSPGGAIEAALVWTDGPEADADPRKPAGPKPCRPGP